MKKIVFITLLLILGVFAVGCDVIEEKSTLSGAFGGDSGEEIKATPEVLGADNVR